MSIEKRQSKRIHLHFEVHVRYRDRRTFSVQAKNTNIDGMFLETSNLRIGRSTLIELEFTLGGRNWSIPALVVHTKNNGFGVLFHEPQHALFDIIQAMGAANPVTSPRKASRRACHTGAN